MQISGPGEYSVQAKNHGPAFTMAGLPPTKKVESLPGPYLVAEKGLNGPAFTIGVRFAEPPKADHPGPGMYGDPYATLIAAHNIKGVYPVTRFRT